MMQKSILFVLAFLASVPAFAIQVPHEINYQGFVEVVGIAFDGTGAFKFAIVDATGSTTFWSNDGTSVAGSEPTDGVSLSVSAGLLNTRLGDSSHPNMNPLPPSVFMNPDTWLEIWFNDGVHGFQKLGPKQKLASVPYAMVSQSVADNSIDGWKLQRESVWPEHEGRGNTVVAYCQTYAGSFIPLGTVPAGKTLVITDIYFSCIDLSFDSYIEVRTESGPTQVVIFKGRQGVSTSGYRSPRPVAFKGGIPVQEGWEIQARSYGSSQDHWCVISGYEISN